MTTPDSALHALSESLTAADSPLAANLAQILTDAIQELVEAEVTARIGAEPHERTPARTNQRNRHRDRLVSTPAGDVTVGIPKVRKGSFFPELLEPRRRIDKALWAVIMTAYITGTSIRKVDDLVKALGCDTGISKSSVSRICRNLDADVSILRNRDLGHQRFVYLWLDATYVHVRDAGQVTSKAVVIATGLRADESGRHCVVDFVAASQHLSRRHLRVLAEVHRPTDRSPMPRQVPGQHHYVGRLAPAEQKAVLVPGRRGVVLASLQRCASCD